MMRLMNPMRNNVRLLVLLAPLLPLVVFGIGQPLIVASSPSDGSFTLVSGRATPVIQVDDQDWPGVIRAAASPGRRLGSRA